MDYEENFEWDLGVDNSIRFLCNCNYNYWVRKLLILPV